jgi:flagellar biosynthesis chaperone FliJ
MLRRIRRRAVEQARHALAACQRTETEAVDKLRTIDESAERDRVAKRSLAEAYCFIDMFVLRSQAGATERHAAEAALTAARAAAAEARAALVAARMAAESVETLVEERADSAEADANRREQHALDDMARTRFDSAGR